MEVTTYSFTDLAGSISHPTFGAYLFDGTGIGSVTISKATDRTAHDVAADGSVMVSKIAGNNGTLTIECQQTSAIHKWLLAWFNVLWQLPTSEWASTSITLRNSATGTRHIISGVSPQKEPDTPYQSQGQRVTWNLMCAEITNLPI
jgi:hypothetical protein|nr:MAG TPA: Protein of unknown function (DUF3277) [Caudoviricetes sp.]